MILLTNEDLNVFSGFVDELGMIFYAGSFIHAKTPDGKVNAIQVAGLFNQYLLSCTDLQEKIAEYLTKEKNINIGDIYAERLRYSMWEKGTMEAYTRRIKDGKYYPKDHQEIYDVIEKQLCDSNSMFKIMYSLAVQCKDDVIAAKCFSLILTKKRKPSEILLLDQEKMLRVWNKRFKNIDVSKISPEAAQIIENLGANATNDNKNNLIKRTDGHILEIELNADLLSKNNKLSMAKNLDAILALTLNFKNFSNVSKDLQDIFSVYKFRYTNEEKSPVVTIEFHYSDVTKKESIYSLICDLVDYALKPIDKKNLQGPSLRQLENKNQFFNSYLMNYALESSLPHKSDSTPPKKNKI